MKYFTSEWYEMCQNANWHLNMSVSKNAEEFSEEYYKDLYTRRRRAFVKEQKEVAEVLGEEFSKVKAEVEFMNQHEATVKRMEASIPQNILAEVADTRVLALDIATKEVRQKLKAWCEQNAKAADEMVKAYDGLTVEENLQFFARLFGQEAEERRRRIDRLTRSTGLYKFLNRPAGKLSGGMKQKLGLCCSLIHDPELLILDEPTTGVDPLARR